MPNWIIVGVKLQPTESEPCYYCGIPAILIVQGYECASSNRETEICAACYDSRYPRYAGLRFP